MRWCSSQKIKYRDGNHRPKQATAFCRARSSFVPGGRGIICFHVARNIDALIPENYGESTARLHRRLNIDGIKNARGRFEGEAMRVLPWLVRCDIPCGLKFSYFENCHPLVPPRPSPHGQHRSSRCCFYGRAGCSNLCFERLGKGVSPAYCRERGQTHTFTYQTPIQP